MGIFTDFLLYYKNTRNQNERYFVVYWLRMYSNVHARGLLSCVRIKKGIQMTRTIAIAVAVGLAAAVAVLLIHEEVKGVGVSFSKIKRDGKAKQKKKNRKHLEQKRKEAFNKAIHVSELVPAKTYKDTLYK